MKKWTAKEIADNWDDVAYVKADVKRLKMWEKKVFVALDDLVAELKKRRKWNIYGDKVAEPARKNELDDMLEELVKK